ncbi:MAG TPA: methyltransferase domain-containing protein [Terriglobia bacterium]|nr:methyltransferase domain-containing protein [Terriglobia bacterium]
MPVFNKGLLEGFNKATALPSDKNQQRQWQAANRSWWESNPMQYNWTNPLQFEKFSPEWFREIDRRFFEDSQTYAPYKRIPFDPLIDFAALRDRDVLEIGVGMGTHAQLLASHARSFTGVDLTETAISTTKRRFEVARVSGKLLRMDAESLEFPDRSFDTVWSWGVIHHSSNTPLVLSEIHRVLRPGGQARIMVYHRGALYFMLGLSGALGHGWQAAVQRRTDGALGRYYSVPEWKTLAAKTGFRVSNVRIFGSIQEAIPLPAGALKSKLCQVLPGAAARGLLTHARLGSYLFCVLDKI